jgi:hypothetical protein
LVRLIKNGKTILKETGDTLLRDRNNQTVDRRPWPTDDAMLSANAFEENHENWQANNGGDDEEIEIVDMTVGCKWIKAISKSSTAV